MSLMTLSFKRTIDCKWMERGSEAERQKLGCLTCLCFLSFVCSQGLHKPLHRIAVAEARRLQLTKIYAVALTTSFRKPNKLYRFQDICKAMWNGPEAMVVLRDLSLEQQQQSQQQQ
jgi:hypothetical protein